MHYYLLSSWTSTNPCCVFFKVLEHIRLPLISPSYLHTVVERLEEVVKDQQSCQRFISEAKGEQPGSTNTAHHVEPRGSPGSLMNTCIHTATDHCLPWARSVLHTYNGKIPCYMEISISIYKNGLNVFAMFIEKPEC